MRLWSLHPSYLDTKGLLAVWREGLLALHVLQGQTRGYTRHPQLIRFQASSQPVATIEAYLHAVVDEAERRGFSFKREKLGPQLAVEKIAVTAGQLRYEAEHLLKKLEVRDQKRFLEYRQLDDFQSHPLFKVVPGLVEAWEKTKTS